MEQVKLTADGSASRVARWADEARAMGYAVGTDDKGYVHCLLYPDHDWRECDWYKTADPDAPLGDRLCYACRELPGRERHARKVLGCTGPSWEVYGAPQIIAAHVDANR